MLRLAELSKFVWVLRCRLHQDHLPLAFDKLDQYVLVRHSFIASKLDQVLYLERLTTTFELLTNELFAINLSPKHVVPNLGWIDGGLMTPKLAAELERQAGSDLSPLVQSPPGSPDR